MAGACRRESSLAYQVLLGMLEERFPIILTEAMVLEYADVLGRPQVRQLTRLDRPQSEDLIMDLIALSQQVQTCFS